MVKFPFPVKEKIIVGSRFEIRDLLIAEKYHTPYLVLSINEQGARLYSGQMDQLHEIKDNNFPSTHTEEYEYNPPGKANFYSGSSVVQQYEKDKSSQQAIHFKKFLQEVDEKLKQYLSETPLLIITAPKKELAWFNRITDHAGQIKGTIHGNFQHNKLNDLETICWKEMKNHLNQDSRHEFDLFREKIGEKLAVFGIDEVWKSAREGKALSLLVEKDFMFPAYTDEQDYDLQSSPKGKVEKALPDAVDDLIRMVLDKNGGVCFTENDQLIDFNRIALITRY
jgi:Bacterial archaeo-eukaryotic release factor family 3